MVFSNAMLANTTTVGPDMFPDNMNTPRDAYRAVTKTTPAAYVAISVQDINWPGEMFTIGNDTARSTNPPLRTGFGYRAFI